MKFGLLLAPFDADTFPRLARRAEEGGFDFLGVPDSQLLMQELHTSLGVLAEVTDTIELGSSVTNPVTRHPAVTASAFRTLNRFSDGRAVLGLGGGDSAVFTLGESPANLSEIETTIQVIQRLYRGRTVEYNGHELELTWQEEETTNDAIPVLLAASGPRTLRLGGRIADRVLIGSGITPEVVEHAASLIHQGARDAGRDPQDVEIWIWPAAVVTDRPEDYREVVQSVTAGAAHLTFQFTLEDKQLPDEYRGSMRELVDRYDSHEHMGVGGGPDPNRDLVEELGLTDYLRDRFCLVGPADHVRDRLSTIAATDVVDGVHCLPLTGPDDFIPTMTQDVIEPLAS